MNFQNSVNQNLNKTHKDYVLKASFMGCPLEDRKNFINASCIVPISVGQEAHEGDKFISTIKLLNQSFKQVTILVNDTIQRYTLAIKSGKNPEQEYQLSLQYGDEWLKRNKVYIDSMTIPYKIVRWDDYINSNAFAGQLDLIEKIYNSDKEYHDEVNLNIKSFLERYSKHTSALQHEEYNRAHALCLEYLKEECAGMCLWTSDHYDFEVYHSGRNQSMRITYEKIIKPNYPNLLKSVSLRFKKFYSKNSTNSQQNSVSEI